MRSGVLSKGMSKKELRFSYFHSLFLRMSANANEQTDERLTETKVKIIDKVYIKNKI